jgi:hypothetical protein
VSCQHPLAATIGQNLSWHVPLEYILEMLYQHVAPFEKSNQQDRKVSHSIDCCCHHKEGPVCLYKNSTCLPHFTFHPHKQTITIIISSLQFRTLQTTTKPISASPSAFHQPTKQKCPPNPPPATQPPPPPPSAPASAQSNPKQKSTTPACKAPTNCTTAPQP